MVRMFLTVVGLVFLLSGPAEAAKKTEKQKCLQGATDVLVYMDSEDAPEPGEKTRAKVDEILEIAIHLCEQGNFRYAENLLALARGMVVSE